MAFRRFKKRDASLGIPVEPVLRLWKEKGEILLVDVRPEAEFEKFRIPGSVNIALYALQTKSFLRSKTVVLVNEGYHRSPLEFTCKWLRDKGFSVRVLNGGLSGWREAGGVIDGDAFAVKEVNRVSPRALFEEKDYEDGTILDTSSPENLQARSWISRSIALPFTDRDAFMTSFQRLLMAPKDKLIATVLILNENGQGYERIERALRGAGVQNLFFLRGGLEAYKGFLERQALVKKGKAQPGRKRGGCPNCP